MPNPILARADALMQRRRQPGEAEEVPILTDAISEDDDLPVLLDAEPPSLEATPAKPAPAASDDHDLRDLMLRELARRVEQRIIAELPRLVEASVREFILEQDHVRPPPT